MINKNKKIIDARSVSMVCKICGNQSRMIHKYGIGICGRCFREIASKIGFKKYN